MQTINSDISNSSFKPYIYSHRDETKWNWSFNKKETSGNSNILLLISLCSVILLFLLIKY